MTTIGLPHFLIVGAILFALGMVTVVTRRNAVGILMGVELILNAANVNFIAFNHFVEGPGRLTGQVFSIFVIVLAAAEAAVGLAIVLAIYQTFRTIDVEETDLLREGGHEFRERRARDPCRVVVADSAPSAARRGAEHRLRPVAAAAL